MAKYKTKSIIIGRMKRKDNSREDYPCFISLFSINDPHKTGNVPDKIIDFENLHKLVISGLDIHYLLAGNDILINDLEYVEVEVKSPHLFVSGKQKK